MHFPPPAPDDTQPTAAFPKVKTTPRAWAFVLRLAAAAQVILIVAALAAVISSWAQDGPRTITVTIIINNETYQRETNAQTVRALLNELAVTLLPEDTLSVNLNDSLHEGMLVHIRRARQVSITVDDTTRKIHTNFDNPLDILKNAGVQFDADDLIFVDGTQTTVSQLVVWPVPAQQIIVRKAVTLTLDDDGTRTVFKTTAPTLGEALFQAGVTLYLGDMITPDASTPLENSLTVSIQRSRPITIMADGVSIETRTQGSTVSAALAESGIALMGLDYALPDENNPVVPGMSIRVIRANEALITEQESLPFETVYQADPNLEIDQRTVVQEGQTGLREMHTRVRYENGIEISRTLEKAVVVREPRSRIVTYGTMIVTRSIDTPDGPREYWRKFRMIATSYHPAALGGDDITATGRKLTKGIVAVDPGIISYGTQVFVAGYGVGLAADTGGPRSTRYWIDLGYDDSNYVSWARWVDVYLLTPIPDRINYLLPQP